MSRSVDPGGLGPTWKALSDPARADLGSMPTSCMTARRPDRRCADLGAAGGKTMGRRLVILAAPGPGRLAAATLFALLAAACDSADDADDGLPPPDPFASLPADGPPPEIGPPPPGYVPTAAQAPSTDVWVGRLERREGRLAVAGLRNLTDRDGYDNQPAFAPDGAALYFVRAVDATQTDVFRHVFATSAIERVTRTEAASEFSPTFIPGQEAFSAVREANGRQHLWRYGRDGQDLGAVFATVEPVGYHAWADARTAVLFVLGEPATLWTADALAGEARAVAERPGRSLHRVPGTRFVSFVRKPQDAPWRIERLDPQSGATEPIAETLPGREDYAWTPDGHVLMGDGTVLHAWTLAEGWTPLADFAGDDGGDISRIAVAPDGTRLALTRERTPSS